MPLNDRDYQDILQNLRRSLREQGFGGIDERIVSDIRGSEGSYYDLAFYLKHLIEEVSLGSDEQIREVLRRVRGAVHTESGQPVDGIRVQLSPEEAERYSTREVDFAPSSDLREIATELRGVLEELHADRDRPNDRGLER